ncbi:MAG: hypothetical protein ACFFD4_09220 [Candidatus Odinarchaeota archaeon]
MLLPGQWSHPGSQITKFSSGISDSIDVAVNVSPVTSVQYAQNVASYFE